MHGGIASCEESGRSGSDQDGWRRGSGGGVKDIYGEIQDTLGIDFVPNTYKVMAPNPTDLEANRNKVKAVMIESQNLDRLTKEIIAVAVSATNGCDH